MIIYQWLQVIIYETANFFSLKGAVNDSIVQFRNWLFLVYYSLFKHTKDILYLLDSLISSVSFYKSMQGMSQQSFLPSVSVLLISEILLMNTEIHTYTYSSDVCIYLFVKQRYHITSTFSARPFFSQFPHGNITEYIQTSLLLLQENKNTETVFEDQNCKRKKLFKLIRQKTYFLPSSSVGTATYIYLHFI